MAQGAGTFNITQARVEEIRVFEQCLEGFMDVIGDIGSPEGQKKWTVVNVAGPNYFRELARDKKVPTLPFLAVIVSSMRPNEDVVYNPQATYLGRRVTDNEAGMQVILHFKPVAVDVQCILLAQSLVDVTSFAQRWLFREPEAQFVLATDHYNLSIRVKFNPELTIPEEDFGDLGNLFTFTCSAVFYTYVGVIETKPVLKSIKLSTHVVNKESTYDVQDSSVIIQSKDSTDS